MIWPVEAGVCQESIVMGCVTDTAWKFVILFDDIQARPQESPMSIQIHVEDLDIFTHDLVTLQEVSCRFLNEIDHIILNFHH